MWSLPQWKNSLYGNGTTTQRLEKYAQVFNTVEGNTTFYALPKLTSVQNWRDAVDEHFKFTFKLPKTITHDLQLQHCNAELKAFFDTMAPLIEKTAIWKIQLPAKFGPHSLANLDRFLAQFPKELTVGVEVRHLAFFDKGEHEKALNQMLIKHHSNRIIIDTRPVFAAKPDHPAIIDGQQKKPKVPVHPIATAQQPVVRFIGELNSEINQAYFGKWAHKIAQWIEQGKQPYVFIHTPDNVAAPELAVTLNDMIRECSTHSIAPIKLLDNLLPEANSVDQLQLDI
ncbi:DUF72 domain-containing protein [Shewanella gaetbuli]